MSLWRHSENAHPLLFDSPRNPPTPVASTPLSDRSSCSTRGFPERNRGERMVSKPNHQYGPIATQSPPIVRRREFVAAGLNPWLRLRPRSDTADIVADGLTVVATLAIGENNKVCIAEIICGRRPVPICNCIGK